MNGDHDMEGKHLRDTKGAIVISVSDGCFGGCIALQPWDTPRG
jgi:hypothetical protein